MVRIEKEAINCLPIGRWQGQTRVVRTVIEVSAAVADLAGSPLLGFDTETRPAFRKGQKFAPSLLQLASAETVFLFQLQQTGLPAPLLALLADPAILKAGVGLDFDLRSLQELQSFEPRGFIDLAKLARGKGVKNSGLRGLAAVVCGIRISKSARTSNWANPDLSPQQVQYAVTDAWIGRQIFLGLEQMSSPPVP